MGMQMEVSKMKTPKMKTKDPLKDEDLENKDPLENEDPRENWCVKSWKDSTI